MSKSQGHLAIMSRLATMVDAPNVVWDDDDGSGDTSLPRIVMTAVGGGQQTLTMDGTIQADPEVMAMVETEKGNFGVTSRQIIDQIHSRFRVGDKFDGVQILQAPDERPPLTDSAAHRVPVYIRGRIFFKTGA